MMKANFNLNQLMVSYRLLVNIGGFTIEEFALEKVYTSAEPMLTLLSREASSYKWSN